MKKLQALMMAFGLVIGTANLALASSDKKDDHKEEKKDDHGKDHKKKH
jgi:hypothetical protein